MARRLGRPRRGEGCAGAGRGRSSAKGRHGRGGNGTARHGPARPGPPLPAAGLPAAGPGAGAVGFRAFCSEKMLALPCRMHCGCRCRLSARDRFLLFEARGLGGIGVGEGGQ